MLELLLNRRRHVKLKHSLLLISRWSPRQRQVQQQQQGEGLTPAGCLSWASPSPIMATAATRSQPIILPPAGRVSRRASVWLLLMHGFGMSGRSWGGAGGGRKWRECDNVAGKRSRLLPAILRNSAVSEQPCSAANANGALTYGDAGAPPCSAANANGANVR